ncbi:MAG TPA: hypothetical protein VGO34_11450 [Alphaproteobacteria bacterium]|jgi:hypothetical protein
MRRRFSSIMLLLIAGVLLSGLALSACSFGSPSTAGHNSDSVEPDYSKGDHASSS